MPFESDPICRKTFLEIRIRKPGLAVILGANLIAAPAWSQPHSVSGVSSDGVLNIRTDIDYNLEVSASEIIGTIPHDATDVMVTGVSVEIGDAKWREVEYKGTVGWVNDRYLKPTNLLLQPPEALQCAGTEPFWNVDIDESSSTFISPELENQIALEYLSFEPGIGRTDLWGHYLGSADGAHNITVIVRYTEACFDGMSDLTYDFDAILLGLGGSGAPVHGCCTYKIR
ncbi:MAG: hypothetical protein ACR2O2_03415 [Ruegeria sp.]